MSNDKMREEFKEWARSKGMSLPVNDEIDYNDWTQLAWDAWQASRAALVIELPATTVIFKGMGGDEVRCLAGPDIILAECINAIEAAGAKAVCNDDSDLNSSQEILARVRTGQEAVHSAADVRKDLGLDDGVKS